MKPMTLCLFLIFSCGLLIPASNVLFAQPAVQLDERIAEAEASLEGKLISLETPGDREFIIDRAGLLTEEDKQKIQALADQLLTDKAAPLVVVTIESMEKYSLVARRIETFARMLFDQWEIGPAMLGETTWNKGILLLVSRDDRRARIELGAGWGREQDDLCQRIMDEQIIPRFREGNFSAGIVAGVESLEKMARGLEIPAPPKPAWFYPVVIGLAALAIFTVVSLIRRGSSGWAWLLWGAIFAIVGYILYQMATSQRSSGGGFGGGFSGGGFGGGGFSGGGGASGSW